MGTPSILKVTILGVTLSIKSSEDNKYLQEIVNFFKIKVNETQKKLPSADQLKVALIAGLNMAEELIKERKKHEEQALKSNSLLEKDAEEINSTTTRILNIIDQIL
jgi:cell division protein ZapA (FtsZ GTPase activity inhibitor)